MAVYRYILISPPPPKSLPSKTEKPPTAGKLPPYDITAEQLPPYLGFTASAEVVTAKKQKTAYRQKINAVWHYRPKSTPICDTAYKSTAMSEWSKGMAVRLFLVGIRYLQLGFKPTPGTFLFFGIFLFFCSLFMWSFGSSGFLFGRTLS